MDTLSGKDCSALGIFSIQWRVPNRIRCDNATNLVWTAKNFVGRKGEKPEWIFNPPLAPHMGGTWERLKRSIKTTISRLPIPTDITLTQLKLFMSHVVDIVNSRPLTRVPVRSEDDPPITPNHFLRPCMSDEIHH